MESGRRVVIIGAGVAGISAASAVRETDENAVITIIEEENDFPYHRALIGDVVLGSKGEDEILIRPVEFYDECCIRLRKGQRVLKVSPSGRYVYLSNNEQLPYDVLLISVGRREIIPAHLRKYAPLLTLFSCLDDAFKVKGTIPVAKRAVLRGKGFNALELARVLLRSGVEVVFVTPDERLSYEALPDEENERLRDLIIGTGILLIEGDDINHIERKARTSFRVELLSGQSFDCEIVFASGGFVPNVRFLRNSGIYINRGIIVDDYLQTTEEGIFAAGDCSEIYHPAISSYWVNLGRPNAEKQGEVAGRNMVGEAMERLEIERMRPYTVFGEDFYAKWWD